MVRPRSTPSLMNVAEPPRDGEFFFEDGEGEQRQEVARWLRWLERHPAWSLGSAVALGVIIASVLLKL